MRNPGNSRRCAGFTLIEVLVAVLVLSIGLLGLAGLQASSVRQNYSAYLRSQASLLAYDMLDRMRGNREQAMDGDYDITFTDTSGLPTTTATVADKDLKSWGTAVLDLLPGSGASVDIDADNVVTITITWDDSRGQGTDQTTAAAESTAFQFQTQL